MTGLLAFLESSTLVVDSFGLTLLLLGFLRGAAGWIRLEWERQPWSERTLSLAQLRSVVGLHIIYALELMIVSDIIMSFIAVAQYQAGGENFFESAAFYALVQLSMIVAIRTVIDYFLARELE